MNDNRKDIGIDHQDHPHQEGNGNNTAPINRGSGQRHSENRNQPMSNMMNESDEQKAGRAHGQKNEGEIQDEERMP
jgi:hypothetical protein